MNVPPFIYPSFYLLSLSSVHPFQCVTEIGIKLFTKRYISVHILKEFITVILDFMDTGQDYDLQLIFKVTGTLVLNNYPLDPI